ncbi:hypothetical protein SMD44_07408 [Streptomyces alboflavus]|uniref:Uncharacterized protein n=1 Tax=Streptomyces alboflavus TaxID=67267 RepID=A0A1Z1WND1_9ACTN|nr:hypothetical protein SMD44_07408 [Streptomyces alboflavus]
MRAPAGAAVREGGYAVADGAPPQVERGPGWALARTEAGLTSAVVGLHGWGAEPEAADAVREVEANAYGPHSATPYLLAGAHPGGASVHVTLVVLTRDDVRPWALKEAIGCVVRGDAVRVTFPDGEELVL